MQKVPRAKFKLRHYQAVEDIDEISRICVKRDFPKMWMQFRSQSAKKLGGVGTRGYQSRIRDAVLQRGFYRRAIGGYAQGRRRMLSRRWGWGAGP